MGCPTQKEGLTAQKCAHLVLDRGWTQFGIPSVATSDQGPQFAGAWWRTMCARLGVRTAYSQAHRPQANGRAEVAGKRVLSILRKLQAEESINWVEALPRVLRIHHDTVNDTGMTPYEVLFGRERGLASLPYAPIRECEDAQESFDRIEGIDRKISVAYRKLHEEAEARVNARRPFGLGPETKRGWRE